MCTSIVEVAEAARLQPEMVMELNTAAPASGIDTLVPLVPLQPVGGGGVAPLLTNSSRFGEPVPGLPTTPVVASATIRSRTCCGVRLGLPPRINAATPATCGVAIEVPLMVLVAVSLVDQDEVMPTPGAKMSSHDHQYLHSSPTPLPSEPRSAIAAGSRPAL